MKLFKRKDAGGPNGFWYASFKGPNGKRVKKCTFHTDREKAQAFMAKEHNAAWLEQVGFVDSASKRVIEQRRKPIDEHLAEMRAALVTSGRSEAYIKDVARIVEDVAKFNGWSALSDISAEGLERYTAEKMRTGKRAIGSDGGWSARTIQKTITALKRLTRWAVSTGRLAVDPLASVKKPNPEADRRLERRMLLQEEWLWLARAVESQPPMNGLTGPQRGVLYRLAIETGLRAKELGSLTKGQLTLGKQSYVTVKAAGTKNKKPAQQFISSGLAKKLKAMAGKLNAGEGLFKYRDRTILSNVLRRDLAAARGLWLADAKDDKDRAKRNRSDFLKPVNHAGEEITFHSLRHTTGAWLALAGEPLKLIQTVMRHSTPVLTISRYGHLMPQQEATSIERLGQMLDEG